MARLGDMCDILNGYAFKSENYVSEGVRIIRIANVQKGYIEDSSPVFYPKDDPIVSKYALFDSDLLLSLTGNVGRVALLEKEYLPASLNQRVACIRIKDETQIDKAFLFNFLNSDYFEQKCIQSSKGVAQKNMSTEWLKEYEIPLPDLETQNRIAALLNKVNNLISLRKQQLAKLDELIKARFVEMFGMPGTDRQKWEIQPLGECCDLNPKKGNDNRLIAGLDVSFVPMPAVSENGDIDTSESKKYEEVKTGFTYFIEDDVLFAKITPCMENGKGAVATGLRNGIGFGSTEFHVLRPIKGISNSRWLYTLTSFDAFRKDAAANMTGSAGQRRVPSTFLEKYRVALPPLELQNEFSAFATNVNKAKVPVQQSLDKLETLKASLMQQYFG